MSRIEDVLYNHYGGVLKNVRDGNYKISEEEREVMLEFATNFNEKLKKGQITSKDVAMAIETVYYISHFAKGESDEVLAFELYYNMAKDI